MPKSILAAKLKEKGITTTGELARVLEVDLAQASKWLHGAGFSVGTAKKIAEIIGEAWPTVYSWQDGNSINRKPKGRRQRGKAVSPTARS